MQHTTKKLDPRGFALLGLFVFFVLIFTMAWGALRTESAEQAPAAPDWTPVYSESFEGSLSDWTISDLDGATNGEYYWGPTNVRASDGSQSMWATGAGTNGSSLTPGTDNYPNNAISSMIRSAVSLTDTTNARLTFDYWLKTEQNNDNLQVRVSTDNTTYTPVSTYSGNSGGWQTTTVDLSSYTGQATVSIEFLFSSNGLTTDEGVYIDNVILETLGNQISYLPLVKLDPTPTATATPPYFYLEDFEGPNRDWPVVDNRSNPQDCFRWYYEDGVYKVEICDDRTDVKVSPLVALPDGDYQMDAHARFRFDGGWWTSYGIIFDGKDDPDPNKPDLGDYYMIWVLWTSESSTPRALWKILRDVPGAQEDVTSWSELPSSHYNYGSQGLEWNKWTIVRTENTISVYVNDKLLRTVNEPRPRTNNQILFGVYASTYETAKMASAYDNIQVKALNGDFMDVRPLGPTPFYTSGRFGLEGLLPPAPPRLDE